MGDLGLGSVRFLNAGIVKSCFRCSGTITTYFYVKPIEYAAFCVFVLAVLLAAGHIKLVS